MSKQPKTIYRGNNKLFPITVTQKSDGAIVDLTGATLTMEVKLKPGDADPALISKTATLTDPTNGKAEFELEPSDTSSLDPGLYAYDVVLVTATSKRYTIIGPQDFRVLAVVNQV